MKPGRDTKAGASFVMLGLGFVVYALMDLQIGTLNRMGPGFFPLWLAVILIALGAGILLAGQDRDAAGGAIPWRPVLLVVTSLFIFTLTLRGIGMFPAVAAMVLVSAFASRKVTVSQALVATAGVTAFCVLVFHYALNLNVQLVGPWLRPG